jgi:DNA excision repair protein ERCC-3
MTLENDLHALESDLAKLTAKVNEEKNRVAALKDADKAKHRIEGVSDEDWLKFAKKPYVLLPGLRKNTVLVAVPKLVKNFQPGWLYKEDETYYVYEVNQYSRWLGEVPQEILDRLEAPALDGVTVEGNQIVFRPSAKDLVKRQLGKHLKEFTENSAVVLQGHEFSVIADIVAAGCLPFTLRSVAKEDRREAKANIKLRDYQQPAFNEFFESGAIGLFYPTGAGKSMITLAIMDELKGPKLIVVPSRTLVEQWEYYIETYAPHLKNEVKIATYQGYRDFDTPYTLVAFDEAQRLPADTFSRLALIKTKYRLGLSASPHREDGRENFIFALTGKPLGINWPEYMKQAGRQYHEINVYIVKNIAAKCSLVSRLVNKERKTLIFSDSLELGKRIASNLGAPFISGETANRLNIISGNRVIVASRVLDLGVSIKDLQHIVEVDFLFGSRQQELQRTGRLMHAVDVVGKRHDIIMLDEEYAGYGKRLWALQEKGFKIKVKSADT